MRPRTFGPEDGAELYARYQAGASLGELAAVYECSTDTVRKALHALGAAIRRGPGRLERIECTPEPCGQLPPRTRPTLRGRLEEAEAQLTELRTMLIENERALLRQRLEIAELRTRLAQAEAERDSCLDPRSRAG